MSRTILTITLCLSIVFNSFGVNTAKAYSVFDAPDTLVNGVDTAGTWTQIAKDAIKDIMKQINAVVISGMQIAALIAEQKAMQAIVGGSKGDTIVTDYTDYLYSQPQKKALAQMDAFFNSATKGKMSSYNYEGIGNNYYNYLVKQAKNSIVGSDFQVTLQDQVSTPSDVFSTGNMRGITSYLQCANMVSCFSLVSKEKYNQYYDQSQTVASKEVVNGFIPRKVNGVITQPAIVAQQAIDQMQKQGQTLILSANPNGEISAAATQIAKGTAMSIAARAANYYVSSGKKKVASEIKDFKFAF